MSSYQRVGHHTCEARKSKENTLKEVPYKSKYTNVSRNYLGTGYYFWEDNLYTAKWWGKLHYKNNYYIVEFILNIFDEELLDLVGNTKQIREFYELYSSFRERVRNELEEDLTLSDFIEFLKKNNLFNFKIIKAVDNSSFLDEFVVKFTKDKKSFVYLNPKIFYCFIEKSDKYFLKKRIVYEQNARS